MDLRLILLILDLIILGLGLLILGPGYYILGPGYYTGPGPLLATLGTPCRTPVSARPAGYSTVRHEEWAMGLEYEPFTRHLRTLEYNYILV